VFGSEINVVIIFEYQRCFLGVGVCRNHYVGGMSVLLNLLLDNLIYILNIVAAFWYKNIIIIIIII